jgi:hypothetical protein
MENQELVCTNAECKLESEGKCVEGYEVEDCPHVGGLSLDDIPETEELAAPAPLPELTIALASGEALNRVNTSILQRRNLSKSIGLIGPNDSGKTSLISGVYDLLQGGPVSGAAFAGSSTLIGFEKVCHLARVVSRGVAPHTERTSRGADATFFHLDIYQEDVGITSVFISDRSGEDYLAVTDQISLADQFYEIRRADCITLLVNGAQLADPKMRHEVKAATPHIVDALIEAKAIRKGCRLAVVLTKKDSVVISQDPDRVQRDFGELVESIIRAHAAYLGDVKQFIVAASPQDCEHVSRGEGVADLLLYWLNVTVPATASVEDVSPDFERMIDLLTNVRPEE